MKKLILLIFFILFSSQAFADRGGTLVGAPVTVGSSDNTFPVAYCDEINGCDQKVADLTARDAIPDARRVPGMTCYVNSNQKTYRLNGGTLNANWTEINPGSPAGSAKELQFRNTGAFGAVTGSAVDTNGNVGLGSATPATKLDVNGTAQATALQTTTGGTTIAKGLTTSTGIAWKNQDSAATDHTFILDNGNVGIGTSSPANPLYVIGNATATGVITAGGSGSQVIGRNVTLDFTTSGIFTVQMTNHGNNENLTVDGESTANQLTFGSTTGVTNYVFPQTLQVNRLYLGGVHQGTTFNVSDGVVSFWEFEEPTGSTAADNQGINDCTIAGTTADSLADQGRINNGFLFNPAGGTTQYLNCGSDNSLKIAGDFAVNFWVKTTTASTLRIMGNRSATGTNVGWEAVIQAGTARFLFDTGSPLGDDQSTTLINTGAWFMVTLNRTSTTWDLYVNGILEDTAILAGDVGTSSGVMTIGSSPIGGATLGQYFTGTLDNPAIFNRALTLNEITNLYNGSTGTNLLSSSGTSLNTQVIGTSAAITSHHGLNLLKHLVVEGAVETQGGHYNEGGRVEKDSTGGTFTECWTQDGDEVCAVDTDGVLDGN